jgi:DNA-binding GntR family transcriptional regulator
VTVPTQVAATLRKLILGGRLHPGERIVETRLARQLGVGQPTVREALIVLEHEGLVVRKPNCGCSVTKLSRKEINQVYRVRLELESLAAELAAESAGESDSGALIGALRRLRNAASSENIEEWHKCDLEFHETLWALSGNPFLMKALAQITVPFFAFAELVFLEDSPRDLMFQASLHEQIVSAIATGDKAETANEDQCYRDVSLPDTVAHGTE